ncbi:hypothetical protein N5B55_04815 [Ralstonia pickettii]|uniref:hypothetical protein n=1 Tax=Ralstonia pickettii TaxID=329 RepID=UPI0027146563|nr:hypothetical protein [Ralstonia pickettii]WKZ86275.1 hypothetical protein N5B55_04815 [Ralstonia pickettii]
MNFKEYQRQAVLTESVPASINFGTVSLHAALSLAIANAQMMDLVKRAIFYGQAIDKDAMLKNLSSQLQVLDFLGTHTNEGNLADPNDKALFVGDALPPALAGAKLSNVNVRLLHAAVGIFTEGGEALEVILKQLETGEFDPVNWGEEIGGDVSWYQAVGHDAAGTDEEVEREKNIAKLRKRYPDKFNHHDAVNRDLAGERAILEGKVLPGGGLIQVGNPETVAA